MSVSVIKYVKLLPVLSSEYAVRDLAAFPVKRVISKEAVMQSGSKQIMKGNENC